MIKRYILTIILFFCAYTSFAQNSVLDTTHIGFEYYSKIQDRRGFHERLTGYIVILNQSDSTITLETLSKNYRPTKLKSNTINYYFGKFIPHGDTCTIISLSLLNPAFENKSSVSDLITLRLPAYIVKNQNSITFSSPSFLTLPIATQKELQDLRMKILF